MTYRLGKGIIALAVMIAVLCMLPFALGENYSADTMRLLRYDGNVEILDTTGSPVRPEVELGLLRYLRPEELAVAFGSLEIRAADLPEAESGEVAEDRPGNAFIVCRGEVDPERDQHDADDDQSHYADIALFKITVYAPLLVFVMHLEDFMHCGLKPFGAFTGTVDGYLKRL